MSRRLLVIAAFAAALAAPPLSARTHVWRGTASNLFSDHRNWTGGSPAGDPEAELVFPVAVRQSVVNDLDGLTVKSMKFETDGYRIGGKAISLLEGAEIDARDVELGCELLFDSGGVEKLVGGHITYSRPRSASIASAVPDAASNIFEWHFDGVTARVTPGAETVWQFDGFWSNGSSSSHQVIQTIIGDIDRDGRVRWNIRSPERASGIWCVVDVATRSVHALTNDGEVEPEPLDITFLRNAAGDYAWANVFDEHRSLLRILWIRPGVGAWELIPSFRSRDANGQERRLVTFAHGQPVEGSPAPPAGALPGDVFVSTDVGRPEPPRLFATAVDERHFDASHSAPPEVGLHGGSAWENAGRVWFSLVRYGSIDEPATVHYGTEDDTAKAGVDYHPVEGTVSFKRGEAFKNVWIPLIDDDSYDGHHVRLRVVVTGVTGAAIRNSSDPVWINEDDQMPVIDIGSATVVERDEGEQEIAVGVTLTGKTHIPATLSWTASGDLTATGTVSFAPGETRKTLVLKYQANTTPDPHRVTIVRIVNTQNARSGRNGRVEIADDDSLLVAAADAEIEEAEGTAIVGVTLSSAQEARVSVDYTIAPGSDFVAAGRDYEHVSGTLIFEAGETRKEIRIQVHDDDVTEGDEVVTVFLTTAGTGRALRNGSLTIHDDGDFPTLRVDDIVVEEGFWWHFLVMAEPRPERVVEVAVTLESGTAVIGTDVHPTVEWIDNPGWIRPNAGSLFAFVGVYGDDVVEGDETFALRVASADNPAVVLARSQATVKDATGTRPRLSVSNASTREGETATFTVSLSRESTEPVSFRVRTVGDTAEAGTDFEPVSNVYTIPPGELSTTIDVKVLEDHRPELHETFAVELSQPWNAVIGTGVGRGRIFDDDDPEVPVFEMANVSVSEGAGAARFRVTLARAMTRRTSVAFGTRDGTAKAGEDYLASHGEIRFEPGETSKTIDIALVNDARFEEDETFTLRLANGLEAIATILNDDAKARSRSVRH